MAAVGPGRRYFFRAGPGLCGSCRLRLDDGQGAVIAHHVLLFPHSTGPSRMLSSDAGRMICYVRAVGLVPGKDSSFLFPGAKLLPKFRGLLLF